VITNLSQILLNVSKAALKAIAVALSPTQFVSQLLSLALYRSQPCT
jgi:hypothetical protein